MQIYHDSEEAGMKAKMRDRKVMTYFALLSVFGRFNEALAMPDKLSTRNRQYLERLNKTNPPPPPPPAKEPPKLDDEELHYRYEQSRMKYQRQWEKAGKMVVGQETF